MADYIELFRVIAEIGVMFGTFCASAYAAWSSRRNHISITQARMTSAENNEMLKAVVVPAVTTAPTAQITRIN